MLSESMHMQDAPSFRTVHNGLLAHLASLTLSAPSALARSRLTFIRTLTTSYLPDASTYAACFALEAARAEDADADVLEAVYEAWRRRDVVRASLAWAGWLLERKGSGREAAEVVGRARAEVAGEEEKRGALDVGWREAMGRFEGRGGKGDGETGEEEREADENGDVGMHEDM
jgi:U3 small nucleolar RNA-associated protein 6